MKYTLKKPIKLGEQAITELQFRSEVVAGDLRGIRASSLSDPLIEDLLKIAGRLSGQTDSVMNKLSPEDFAQVVEIVGGFLGAGQETGSKPSAS